MLGDGVSQKTCRSVIVFLKFSGNRTGRRFVDYVDDSHLWGELFLFLVCCPLHDVQGLLIISFAETSHN